MTTAAAAQLYELQHTSTWNDLKWVSYNPLSKPVEELPQIFGWNNGGPPQFLSACLIAEDGTALGGHCCSAEGFMLYDLGIVEGSRPERHETFRAHYPDGYRMVWIPSNEVMTHSGLDRACELNRAKATP